jgi:nicotinic acid phosphoribosyltransferase
MLTVAVSVARFTSALATPGTRFSAFSTRMAQEAQVMPSIGSLMMLEVFMATVSTLTQWESQAP